MTPQDAIHAAELVEAETTYRNQLAREMYERGRQAGILEGRRAAEAAESAAWRQLHNDLRGILTSPTQAELEERRWGPDGRAHFADPRPGDFPGRAAKPQAEHHAEQDMEASA